MWRSCGIYSRRLALNGVISNIDNFKMTNLYSTAEIQQVALSSLKQRDNIGLLFSSFYQIVESYEIETGGSGGMNFK